jgi:hypothetical protein
MHTRVSEQDAPVRSAACVFRPCCRRSPRQVGVPFRAPHEGADFASVKRGEAKCGSEAIDSEACIEALGPAGPAHRESLESVHRRSRGEAAIAEERESQIGLSSCRGLDYDSLLTGEQRRQHERHRVALSLHLQFANTESADLEETVSVDGILCVWRRGRGFLAESAIGDCRWEHRSRCRH